MNTSSGSCGADPHSQAKLLQSAVRLATTPTTILWGKRQLLLRRLVFNFYYVKFYLQASVLSTQARPLPGLGAAHQPCSAMQWRWYLWRWVTTPAIIN